MAAATTAAAQESEAEIEDFLEDLMDADDFAHDLAAMRDEEESAETQEQAGGSVLHPIFRSCGNSSIDAIYDINVLQDTGVRANSPALAAYAGSC